MVANPDKEPLQHYRDDGPVTETIAPATAALPIPPLVATPLAALFLVAGLVADGRETGIATIVGLVLFVVLATAGAVKPPKRRIQWLTPPVLRACEYGFVAWLGWRAGLDALPASYALLSAMAFHHYDVVYRIRHQRVAPPTWLFRAGLGWDGRMIIVLVASLAGVFQEAAVVLAIWCGARFVVESVNSWVRIARDTNRTVAVAVEDDEE